MSKKLLLIKYRGNQMINTKAIAFSSIVATLLAGTAAQAQFIPPDDLPPGKPATIDMMGTVEANGSVWNFSYTIGPLGEVERVDADGNVVLDEEGNPVYDLFYDLENPFYVNLETGEVVQGSVGDPDNAGFDYAQYDSLSAILDPNGGFNVSFADFGGASNFSQTFVFPAFAPDIPGLARFAGSLAGSLFDLTGNGVSITPNGQPSTIAINLYDNNNTIISTLNFGDILAIANADSDPAQSHTYGPFGNTDSPLLVNCAPAGCGRVEIELGFTGSGGGDRYGLVGGFNVVGVEGPPVSVPEPGTTAALVGVGLLGLASWKRKLS
ncbi:PEP-CTERM sorting domain-containing protein [Crocosphaera sp. UHCC 0190]|uniref:PEP-CTERM sorting domain-containing protein n=1 Tax=Crocosphaera sp. UHCC 0190 TaxID=3110246 RepID=UPI002B21562E|nr:PEP-CTERM sorting domain-containing protein [Crocosphaera sp. UHCC 0190]MEA5510056.1 PEP-CTERM sorting domain-containing protein [Crocosphaera sp. UHCC 0190]